MSRDGLVTFEETDGVLSITATGRWTSAMAGDLERALSRLLARSREASGVTIDMAAVNEFDTFGAWLLERFRRDLAALDRPLEVKRMTASNLSLFNEMADVSLAEARPVTRRRPLFELGRLIVWLQRELSSFFLMVGALVVALIRMITHPRSFRLTSTVHQFDRVAWQAVPIILMITFLIGVIIAQQGFFQFRRFGADLYVVNMIGFLIMREMGVLLVAIMVAGRTGSSFTAELGSMKMREEIDALRTMGFDPIEVLVLPRVLVLIVSLPALAFIGSLAALVGGGACRGVLCAHEPATSTLQRLREAITLDYLRVGLIKAPFIGAVIGIIACNEGLQVRGSAASLGEHTTASVVKSIFMIIVLDGLFALFFSASGCRRMLTKNDQRADRSYVSAT